MKSLNSVGLGLSVIFGCLFMALFAELYYLLWWKKRIVNRDTENHCSSPARQLFYLFCWKRQAAALNQEHLCTSMRVTGTLVHQPEGQLHKQTDQELVFKPFGVDDMEAELMRQSALSGPPRFLFTIVEETNEDLESEDGESRKGARSKSLSDFLLTTAETPYLTPLASPPFFTPPLTPTATCNRSGFNPLFELTSDAEFNRIKSSPPPKFKFMQDAEDKLRRKLSEQGQVKVHNTNGFAQHNLSCRSPNSNFNKDEIDGSLITIIVDNNKKEELKCHPHKPQLH